MIVRKLTKNYLNNKNTKNTKNTNDGTQSTATSTETKIKLLYSKLFNQINKGLFLNSLKTVNKLLLYVNDKELVRIKIFLLLQLDKFNLALNLINDCDDDFNYEKAYCLYRLKNESESRLILNKFKVGNDRKWVVLEAQLDYRQGNYEKALDHYQNLSLDVDHRSDEYLDLITNLNASSNNLNFHQYEFQSMVDNDQNLPSIDVLESVIPPFPENYNPPSIDINSSNVKSTSQVNPKKHKLKQKRVDYMKNKYTNRNVDQLDPERWLPLKERSYYKKPKQFNTQGKRK